MFADGNEERDDLLTGVAHGDLVSRTIQVFESRRAPAPVLGDVAAERDVNATHWWRRPLDCQLEHRVQCEFGPLTATLESLESRGGGQQSVCDADAVDHQNS